ncbi:MAG: hypothetical protein COU32_03050 [Candidatus Magasanikbacteria bacterium CG10_big_fil_rev_8_21_14_0_10_42_10]|uniref:Uncharacterized protein n=2 Tax=Candidatus Magasanikiibacteriota TaxID=1752731 RepID=A0A2H0TVN7_9BACT|nr:MAG: hypothetical protein COU32_03050 [Candidatus Magasanikbacteria bacterium CG10_big_fil_rev_8_21_14_0_10_42_10]PIZ93225.1 MAG: hypothetical protein COX82_03220 [Candidatus Magasanikbacteria bacterium CG_4_10_14_0_2_um_filter_41_10]
MGENIVWLIVAKNTNAALLPEGRRFSLTVEAVEELQLEVLELVVVVERRLRLPCAVPERVLTTTVQGAIIDLPHLTLQALPHRRLHAPHGLLALALVPRFTPCGAACFSLNLFTP